MTWFGWVYLATTAVGVLVMITQIGKRRAPLTSGGLIIQLIVTGLIIWGQIAVGMTH